MKKETNVNPEKLLKLYQAAAGFCAKKEFSDLKLLIEEEGLNPNYKPESKQWSLLSMCAYFDFFRGLDFLVASSADVDDKDGKGNTPLMTAVAQNSSLCIKKLIEAGANVNLANNTGLTPFMSACYNGQQYIVGLLLNSGVDISAKDKNGKTAIDYALEQSHYSVLSLLEKKVISEKLKESDKRSGTIKI